MPDTVARNADTLIRYIHLTIRQYLPGRDERRANSIYIEDPHKRCYKRFLRTFTGGQADTAVYKKASTQAAQQRTSERDQGAALPTPFTIDRRSVYAHRSYAKSALIGHKEHLYSLLQSARPHMSGTGAQLTAKSSAISGLATMPRDSAGNA